MNPLYGGFKVTLVKTYNYSHQILPRRTGGRGIYKEDQRCSHSKHCTQPSIAQSPIMEQQLQFDGKFNELWCFEMVL